MAELTEEPLAADRFMDPFAGGGSPRLSWPSPINVAQLQDELSAALGDVRFAAYLPEGSQGEDVIADAEHPYTLFLTPNSVDVPAVERVLAQHRPDAYYGLDGSALQEAQLLDKVRSGAELTIAEMMQALRILVG